MPSQPSHTLIFDLDGTLSDPFRGTYRCMNFALVNAGLPPRTEREIRARIGPPLEETLELFAGGDNPLLIHELVDRYRERYSQIGYAENELYPGTTEMLSHLHERGIRMGVCTSKLRQNAVKILSLFKLQKYFSFVSGPDYGVKKYQQLEELLRDGTIDANSIMIGDRGVDIAAAKTNGLMTAAVSWGFGSLKELELESPDFVFQTPAELAEKLGG
ncbi:MAG: HAD family hydrolase [Pseudohongiellaceae bacterium]